MNKIDFLREQIIESRNFVNRLVSEIPQDLWYEIPENTDSNFAWQIGHLIISQNFQAITCITGKNKKIFDLIPIVDYVKLFNGMGALHFVRFIGDYWLMPNAVSYSILQI